MHEKIRYFSLFSGIGGFELGIQKANELVERTADKNSQSSKPKFEGRKRFREYATCVGFSEINKYAIQTYQRHFPEHRNYGDATKIKTESLPDFDMLCGGFPCQSFSIAGKRRGFQDIRGTLFFEIYRIAKAKKPRLLFLENVKGLLSADDGRCFGTIISSLDELGYDVEWQVLNSKNFGVPQNRERVFIIGHLRGAGGQTVFPLREDGGFPETEYRQPLRWKVHTGKENGKHIDTEDVEDGQDRQLHRGEINVIHNSRTELARIYDSDGLSPTLKGKTGGWQEPKVVVHTTQPRCGNPEQGGTGSLKREDGYSYCLDGGNSQAIECAQALQTDGQLRNGSSWHTDKPQSSRNIRRLTPTECERLQGFPDGWTDGVSDTQRYKQLGNAVTVNVIQAIGRELIAI
ncbi:MAG: DNA (cytosine-5-)-methyltransferase [Actinobacteria bacterium]|nr:DNA (cytosine-5-)-methyltransferase [Actinomycetota bacterium]MBE3122565.1 DNA (cytosine-5-)-methyltransferase [Thermoplasmata archaeon]